MEPEETSNESIEGIKFVSELINIEEPAVVVKEEKQEELLTEIKINEDKPPKIPKKRGIKRKFVDDFNSNVTVTRRQTSLINYCESTTSVGNHSVDLLANYTLNDEETKWLKEQISLSRFNDKFFTCSQCQKILKSYAACRYHLISKHIKSRDSNKDWISQKVKEGEEFSPQGKVVKYNCVFCSKTYSSAPGLRYHLKIHMKTEEPNEPN